MKTAQNSTSIFIKTNNKDLQPRLFLTNFSSERLKKILGNPKLKSATRRLYFDLQCGVEFPLNYPKSFLFFLSPPKQHSSSLAR